MRHGKFVFQNVLRPYYSQSKWNEENIPSGLIFLYDGDTCPAGYEKLVPGEERFLVAGTSYQEDAGGNLNHTHTTGTHTHNLTATAGVNSATGSTYSGDKGKNAGRRHTHGINYGTSTTASPDTAEGNYNNCEIQPTYRFVLCRRI